jgi:hypothetical protein
MALSLTCACGVFLEVDDRFAGQTITCPDCRRPHQLPAATRPDLSLSGYALTSLILALIGAFSVVGTLAAVVFGVLALRQIKRQPDQFAGTRLAQAGIVLGCLFTVASLYIYRAGDRFNLNLWLREQQMAGRVTYSTDQEGKPALEISRRTRSQKWITITRPSEQWGVLDQQAEEARVGSTDDEPTLINVKEDAYVLCLEQTARKSETFDKNVELALNDFREPSLTSPELKRSRGAVFTVRLNSKKVLPNEGEAEVMELVVDKSRAGQRRTYLIRFWWLKADDLMFVVAGGTRSHRFDRLEPELRKAVESFRAQ